VVRRQGRARGGDAVPAAQALAVARFLVLFLKRSGGQAQFSMMLRAQFSATPAIQQVQARCLDDLAGDLSVAALARRAGMSARSFVRAFRGDTGGPPGAFVASARLQAACRLLEETGLAPKSIAGRCGLGTAATMRRTFSRRLGISPLQHRDRFAGQLGA
jgi:transcriptional regulator GlxA family with amidase domain